MPTRRMSNANFYTASTPECQGWIQELTTATFVLDVLAGVGQALGVRVAEQGFQGLAIGRSAFTLRVRQRLTYRGHLLEIGMHG